MTSANLYKNAVLLYFLSLAFLLSLAYTIEYPVDDEASYIAQTELLLEGKTQPNWLQSTSYLTMLVGMPIIQSNLPLVLLRFIMMLFAATLTPLMYLLLKEFGVKSNIAILSSFILLTNPFVATYTRQFMTEPISIPLYIMSTLLIVKGLKADSNMLLNLGFGFGIVGFLNRQTDIIPSLATFLFLLMNLGGGKSYLISKPFNKLLTGMPVLLFLIAFFGYFYLTTGSITNPITVPTTNKHALLSPQFGIGLQSPYRLLQDAIFLGFMFLPFGLYVRKYLNAEIAIGKFRVPSQIFIIITSFIFAALATLSGKNFIVHGNSIVVFVATLIFSYSGLSIGTLILQERLKSKILNYAFFAILGCITFTFFKIGVFILKYYLIFLPFILIFLSTRIKELTPYLLTIALIGGFGVVLTYNTIQFYDNIWNDVNALLEQGVEPTDIQGQYTVDNWLSKSVDNPNAEYKIVWEADGLFSELVNIDSVKVVR